MYCGKCGEQIPDEAAFCPKCGAAVSGMAQAVKPESQTVKRDTGISVQGVIDTVGETVNGIGKKIREAVGSYLNIWKQLENLEKKEKSLWVGVHGGALILILCIIMIPLLSGGVSTTKKAVKEAMEDNAISQEEITNIAGTIGDYEEWQEFEQYWDSTINEYEDTTGYFEYYCLRNNLHDECNKLSDLGSLVENYNTWYDNDGMTEKLYGKADPVEYLYWSSDDMRLNPSPVEEDSLVFRHDENGNSMEIRWFTYAGSDKITFVKFINDESAEQYDGRYVISGTDLIVTLDEKEYSLAEANTDINKKIEESFHTVASGTWGYTQEIYDMLGSKLGGWEKLGKEDMQPLCIDFFAPGFSDLKAIGENGAQVAWIKSEYEQGEGKTVTITCGEYSMEMSYDKVGEDLILTVDGAKYTLSPYTVIITDREKYFFGTSDDNRLF